MTTDPSRRAWDLIESAAGRDTPAGVTAVAEAGVFALLATVDRLTGIAAELSGSRAAIERGLNDLCETIAGRDSSPGTPNPDLGWRVRNAATGQEGVITTAERAGPGTSPSDIRHLVDYGDGNSEWVLRVNLDFIAPPPPGDPAAAEREAIISLAVDCGATGRGDEGNAVPFADLIERYRGDRAGTFGTGTFEARAEESTRRILAISRPAKNSPFARRESWESAVHALTGYAFRAGRAAGARSDDQGWARLARQIARASGRGTSDDEMIMLPARVENLTAAVRTVAAIVTTWQDQEDSVTEPARDARWLARRLITVLSEHVPGDVAAAEETGRGFERMRADGAT